MKKMIDAKQLTEEQRKKIISDETPIEIELNPVIFELKLAQEKQVSIDRCLKCNNNSELYIVCDENNYNMEVLGLPSKIKIGYCKLHYKQLENDIKQYASDSYIKLRYEIDTEED